MNLHLWLDLFAFAVLELKIVRQRDRSVRLRQRQIVQDRDRYYKKSHPQCLDIVRSIGPSCEVRQIELGRENQFPLLSTFQNFIKSFKILNIAGHLDLIPAIIESHGHCANKGLHPVDKI